MKKITSLILASCLMLTACGGGGSQETTVKPAEVTTAVQQPAEDTGGGAADLSALGYTPDKPLILKLGHMGNETNPLNTYSLSFKKRVEERTGGAVQIDIYGDRVLGADRELLEAIQIGTLDMAVTTTSPLTNFVPEYEVLDLPYVFDSWDHAFEFFDSDVYPELLKEGDKVGLTVLSLAARGFRNVTTNDKPIQTLADIKGLKLRVIESTVYVDTFTAFGANPQAMSFGEVFTALQQGTIEGHENSYLVIWEEKVQEVQNMISETQHMFAFFDMVIGTEVLNGMTPELQEIIRTAALEAGVEESKAEQASENKVKDDLRGVGVTIIEDVNRDEFKAVVQPVYDKFKENRDPKYLDGIQGLIKS